MTLKSNEQLNAETPELKDVVVVIDGLNVLDLQGGHGVQIPRYSVQFSGYMGASADNKRIVYTQVAHALRTLLQHGFVAHANIPRENLDNDIARATELMQQAITLLVETGEDVIVRCHSLSISVTTVNFDLTELRVISDEAMAKVEFLLAQPGEPSEALTKLMTGKRKNLIREDLGETAPVTTSLGSTTTIMINDELHVRREFADEYGDVVIVWIPIDLNRDILHTGDVDKTKLSFHGDAPDGKPTFILNRHVVEGNVDQSPI